MQQAIHQPTDPKPSHLSCPPFSCSGNQILHCLHIHLTHHSPSRHSRATLQPTTRNAYLVHRLFSGVRAPLHWRFESLSKHGRSPELTLGVPSAPLASRAYTIVISQDIQSSCLKLSETPLPIGLAVQPVHGVPSFTNHILF